ncbi:hypothetical protein PF008_g10983 [Phytophthora fragariae]|uniref:Uncharacterized protein n=1 Tax=Phytophthora fragariae TaxID=53985 RepID=A0A6G0RSN0_9STRA|nr:hypothetical protein PF008_g10983 [Phytophthora fragariae]
MCTTSSMSPKRCIIGSTLSTLKAILFFFSSFVNIGLAIEVCRCQWQLSVSDVVVQDTQGLSG